MFASLYSSRRNSRFTPHRRLFLEPLEGRSLLAGISVVQLDGTTVVKETGTTDTLAVSLLEGPPTSNVVLNIVSSDPGEATAVPTTLTFTPANWNIPQTVTVTGVDDSVFDGDQPSTITISVDDALSDDAWDPVPNQTVAVVTINNDPPVPGTAVLIPNLDVPDTQTLVVTGTSKSDHINIDLNGGGNIVVTLKGQQIGSFAQTGISLIVVNGNGKNDHITVDSEITIPVEMNGGQGNDHMTGGSGNDVITGGPGNDHFNGGAGDDLLRGDAGNDKLSGDAGNDIVLGNGGNDNLSGGDGHDMIIGGPGNDKLNGGGGDDILIGGTTTLDTNDEALAALFAEWTSGRTFADRVANLSQGTGPILQGTTFRLVQGTTVLNAGHDKLTGGDGDNLLFPATGKNHGNSKANQGNGKAKGHDKNKHID